MSPLMGMSGQSAPIEGLGEAEGKLGVMGQWETSKDYEAYSTELLHALESGRKTFKDHIPGDPCCSGIVWQKLSMPPEQSAEACENPT